MPHYWLFKKEPKNISIDDIKKNGKVEWTGVRNYQARNYLHDSMEICDKVLIYHSNSQPSGIVGLAEISGEPAFDVTAQDPSTSHYDPVATPEKPIWISREVRFLKKFPQIISLEQIKNNPSLQRMLVIKRGMRLSIQPVQEDDYKEIVRIAHQIN